MLTAVVTTIGGSVQVRLVSAEDGESIDPAECEFVEENEAGEEVCGEGPSPVAPELKELLWGGGAFLVLLVIMRLVLFPRLKKGMDARAEHIRSQHEQAEAARAAATAEVAEYEAALATVRSEAAERVDVARQQLEQERAERLATVNASIEAKRQAALADAQAARDAVAGEIAAAAADVATRTVELAIGRAPDAAQVRAAVDAVMSESTAGVR